MTEFPLRLMGVINVTPDSFSDGGRFLDPARAIELGLQLRSEGADILDIGGESTRPGSAPIPVEEELRRVLPVIEGLAQRERSAVSVDTSKYEVARAALDAGATIVNDVTAGRCDPRMLPLVAERGATCVLMHMQGSPRSMQSNPAYVDVVREVADFLRERVDAALSVGVDRERIWIDPGIGFGKTMVHNLELLRNLDRFATLGCAVLIGTSRKSFLGKLLDNAPADQRLHGTIASIAAAVMKGAHIVRVHDVKAAVEATKVADAVVRTSKVKTP